MQKLLYIILILLIGFSCKDSERDLDVLTNTSEENALAEAIYADAFKIVHRAALATKGISRNPTGDTTLFGCDQLIVDTTVTPRRIFIDFRFAGCVATHGISRKGRIIAEFTGTYLDENSIVNILFLNYSFGDYEVDGNIVIANRGLNDAKRPFFTFFLQDGAIKGPRSSMVWQANKTWEYNQGFETVDYTDDLYLATGTSFGTNNNGNEFDTEVTLVNVIKPQCLQVVQGVAKVNVKNLSPRVVDYGKGTCDRTAIVIINGKNHDITLRQ